VLSCVASSSWLMLFFLRACVNRFPKLISAI
jgi:hypothetical protein